MAVDPHACSLAFNGYDGQDVFHKYNHGNPHAPAIRYGVVAQVNANQTTVAGGTPQSSTRIPGTVDVSCYDGTYERNVQLLTDSVDPKSEAGEYGTPYLNSKCILLTTAGGEVFACGFVRPMASGYGQASGQDQYSIPAQSGSQGDWVRTSPSGAEVRLTRGGLIALTASPVARLLLNPSNGEATLYAQTQTLAADGYKGVRGRTPGAAMVPTTVAVDTFSDNVNAAVANAVEVTHGAVGDGSLRRLRVLASGVEIGTETLDPEGNWVGGMQTYRWGSSSADENIPLGQVLKSFLSSFLDLFAQHTHPTGVGPSGPPLEAAQAQKMKADPIESEAFLSSFTFTQKLPPAP